MKAMVLEEPGKMRIKEIPIPLAGDNEVIVKVKACNICKTDLKCLTLGQRDLKYPRILGHEIAGVIDQVGKNVKEYLVGERVHVHPGISCGECDYCKSGWDNLCDAIQIMGFNYDGGFQEYLTIPEKGVRGKIINVIKDESLGFDEVSFIEPLSCCVNIQEGLTLNKNKTMVIIGGGRLGVLNMLVAKANGAGSVILIEKNKKRRESGLRLGFDLALDGNEEEIKEIIKNWTKGKGVDLVIPCCPSPKALDLGLKLLSKKGELGYFSGIINEPGYYPDMNLIHYKEIKVVGSYGCSLSHSHKAQKLLESKKINVAPLISNKIKLEVLEQGMDDVKNSKGYSTIVYFD
jgi:L-iditol 2-dehydrogenase